MTFEARTREWLLDQLRGANEQLVVNSMRAQDLADAAEQSRAEAETANRLKDEFLAMVSHELRTPLNSVLGWAQLLASGQLDPQTATDATTAIVRNAKALARVIDDLLDVSRIVSGKIVIESRPVDLVAVIQGALDEVRLTAEAKGVKLAFSCAAAPQPVVGDSARLQQAVGNLLSNAIKFTPSGGDVEVRVTASSAETEILVADTGAGIAPDVLPHVFDRFVQADSSSTRRQGGLGLGLAIVRALVEAHRGTVRGESPGPGLGATFTLRLPNLRDERFESERGTQPVSGDPIPARLDGISIVLVEDDADGREALALMLQIAGARVVAVDSVHAALEALDTTKPHVLVSDIGMPDEDGYALIRRLREHEAARGDRVPAIAVTGYVRPEEHARLLAAGFQCHLRKPIEPHELVGAVASLAATQS